MKIAMSFFKAVVLVVVIITIVGCSTPMIPVTMKVAGEVKLNGVSKIALVEFNSLPNDLFQGVKAADEETCAMVKRAVASAFYTSPMYQIVDLDIEEAIHDETDANPNKRFDAFIYGRLWWQVMPETSGKYPHKFTLKTWKNVPYMKKDPITGKEMKIMIPVTSETRDVVEMLDYRVRNATLMLTLSIYRLTGNGEIEKIVDTYQVSNEGFTLMNGEMKLDAASVGIQDDNAVTRLQSTGQKEEKRTAYEEMFVPKELSLADIGKAAAEAAGALASGLTSGLSGLGVGDEKKDDAEKKKEETSKAGRKVDANGKLILTQETVSMPTDLQAKLMLAMSISRNLSAKLAPSEVTFNVPANLGDSRLENLLKNGAFGSAKEYSLYMLRTKLGKQVCEKVSEYIPELKAPCSYLIPDSEKTFGEYDERLIEVLRTGNLDLYFYSLGVSHEAAKALEGSAIYKDKMLSYLAGENLDAYFYAIGICDEATQKYDEAGECYRFAFSIDPSMDYAIGISRVLLALGEEGRLKQTMKSKKKATKKAKLD